MELNGTEQYISFWNGFKSKEDMEHRDDFGDPGPIVGPLQFSFTYGNLKLHFAPTWDDFHNLVTNEHGDFVPIDNYYYGDFEIWNANDPLIEAGRKEGRQFLTLEEFIKLNKNFINNF